MVLLHTGLGRLCSCYADICPTSWDLRPNSPDLNQVNGFWGLFQECVYCKPIRDLEELKQRLVNMWADVKQSVLDKAIEH